MSDCSCCEDRHTLLRLVEYWIVNVRHCNPDPYLGHGYQAYTEEFDECGLETWLLGQWASQHHIPYEEQKYLRIKVQHIHDWHTVDDCCNNREVDVLRDINKTLQSYLKSTYGPPPPQQPSSAPAS